MGLSVTVKGIVTLILCMECMSVTMQWGPGLTDVDRRVYSAE